MSSDLQRLLRERIETETNWLRRYDPLLAELLDCPVPVSRVQRVRLGRGSHLQPGRGLETVLAAGWYPPEEWGVWSQGSCSLLRIPLDQTIRFPVRIELKLHGFLGPDGTQSVMITANARSVAQVSFDPARRERSTAIEILEDDVSPELIADIAFDMAAPTAPADVQLSSDRRKLAVGISGLRIC